MKDRFVIVRTDGKYVARSGSEHSYTRLLEMARVYPTREAAEQDRCLDNEAIVAVTDILRP